MPFIHYTYYCFFYFRHRKDNTISYNQLTELEKSVVEQFVIFVKKYLLGKSTSISFVDSTRVRGCRNQASICIGCKGITQSGKYSLVRFYGFMLHLIIDESKCLSIADDLKHPALKVQNK